MRSPPLLGFFLLLSGCGALDDFEEVISDEVTIPGKPPVPGPFDQSYNGGFKNLSLSQEKNFENNGVTPDDVDAIFIKSIVVEMDVNAAVNNLETHFEKIELYVSAPGVDQKIIGTATTFPSAASTQLEADTALNLKPYAVAPSMSIGATITLRNEYLYHIKLKTTVTLLVDINLLGT